MTDLSLSHLPMTAGATLAGSLGRGGVWALNRALDLGLWGIGQFMRAPLAISAAALVVGLSIAAGGNALYFQSGRHPAPLFYPAPRAQVAEHRPAAVAPVIPAPRPHLQPAVDEQTTGSVAGEADAVDSRDVLALQQKLVALKLLSDDPDGLFGKRTATAIKAFEARAGMKADGRLTPAAIAAIMAAPLPAPVAQPQIAAPAPAPQRLPAAQPLPPAAPVVASAAAAPIAMAPIAQPASTAAAGRAQGTGPVPLAPLPEAVAPAVAAAPSPPVVAPVAAAAPQADTFAANSLPDAALTPDPADATVALPTPAPDTAGNVSAVAMTAPSIAPAPDATPPASPAGLTPAQKLAAQMGTLPPEATPVSTTAPAAGGDDLDGSTDPALITRIQRGLASLGFLGAKIDGLPGEATARAIRNFEVFYDYKVTGLATHNLLTLLQQHGAQI